ncbi:uncharacterized protein EI90DRAFT_3117911 [Cantharellus anzutake]|uniref:uncharacterized protein n=1 Tax=Cantharellus anzutake TaxID=1750568 RepID=UPI0019061085|nr:uncharacterized protein EI90DRAFT_3117911 [Cantharellus anzutake]KAF8338836.1 hypothetical protein EI90DRAFT_3117911 [Cantharellus anzutake]
MGAIIVSSELVLIILASFLGGARRSEVFDVFELPLFPLVPKLVLGWAGSSVGQYWIRGCWLGAVISYPTPTRLPDLHPLHLRSHTLPLPFRYSPSVLATHLLLPPTPPLLLLPSPPLSPSAPILTSDRTPPLSPPSYYFSSSYSAPPSQHLHPPITLLHFPHPLRYSPSDLTTLLSTTPSSLPFSSLLPLVLLRWSPAKLRPSTTVPYFVLGHCSYLCSEPPSQSLPRTLTPPRS